MSEIRGPVVAGVDGSPSSLAAVDYAAALAARHQAPLHLVHGYQRPLYGHDRVGMSYLESVSDEQARAQIQNLLHDLVEQLRTEHPGLIAVQALQIDASPAHVLIEQSCTYRTVTYGGGDRGGLPRHRRLCRTAARFSILTARCTRARPGHRHTASDSG